MFNPFKTFLKPDVGSEKFTFSYQRIFINIFSFSVKRWLLSYQNVYWKLHQVVRKTVFQSSSDAYLIIYAYYASFQFIFRLKMHVGTLALWNRNFWTIQTMMFSFIVTFKMGFNFKTSIQVFFTNIKINSFNTRTIIEILSSIYTKHFIALWHALMSLFHKNEIFFFVPSFVTDFSPSTL